MEQVEGRVRRRGGRVRVVDLQAWGREGDEWRWKWRKGKGKRRKIKWRRWRQWDGRFEVVDYTDLEGDG